MSPISYALVILVMLIPNQWIYHHPENHPGYSNVKSHPLHLFWFILYSVRTLQMGEKTNSSLASGYGRQRWLFSVIQAEMSWGVGINTAFQKAKLCIPLNWTCHAALYDRPAQEDGMMSSRELTSNEQAPLCLLFEPLPQVETWLPSRATGVRLLV